MNHRATPLIYLLLSLCSLVTFSNLSYGKLPVNKQWSVHMLMQDSQPKYFLPEEPASDASPSRPIGLCVEIYQALKRRLEEQQITATISSKFLPIKRILKRVEQNPSELFCGAGRNAKREARFIYSKTVVYNVSNVVAAHRSFDKTVNGFEDIQNQQLTVGALYGTSSAGFVKKQVGVPVNDSFLNLETGLQAVANQRIPLFYYHDLGLNFLIKDWQLPLKVLPHKFRTVPQWIIYSKSIDPGLLRHIESALEAMEREGEIKQIWRNYF